MNENLITSFVEITSSTREEASFFLDNHRWDLDAAVSSFLDNDVAADSPAVPNPSLPPPPPSIPVAGGGGDGDSDEGQEYYTGGQKR